MSQNNYYLVNIIIYTQYQEIKKFNKRIGKNS